MSDLNPYRAPLVESASSDSRTSAQASLAIGFLVDGAGVAACAIAMTQAPWLRVFLPFAAGHAVAAALIVYRTRRNGQTLSAGDHFFLRYGAILMATATAGLRAIF